MLTVNRKLIEDYYEKEWSGILSKDTIEQLIEFTCQNYHLNLQIVPDFVRANEPKKPKKIGQL